MSEYQHSVAHDGEHNDGRLYAPAAARNAAPLLEALKPYFPSSGCALEVASGTGEHVVNFAKASPGLLWQPTDIQQERLESIRAWAAFSALPNIAPPLAYDAVAKQWGGPPMNLVFLSNLTHLISTPDTTRLLSHLAGALAPGGVLAIYGPFLRGSTFVSDGDESFDASIRAERPQAGYKDIGWVENQLTELKLAPLETLHMPANNLMTLWKKPT
ncbi:MAG: DUF938 domain-containing protein [Devosiaceae bacterium]